MRLTAWQWMEDDRRLMQVSAAGVVTFLLCYAAAAALYPGGTWADPSAPGHSFWQNYLCDLMQSRAHSGEPAPVSAGLAKLGMVAMMPAMVSFSAQIARLEMPRTRAGRLGVRAAMLAAMLGCLVPLVPSDLWRLGHLTVVVAASIPTMVAAVAAARISLRAPGVSRGVRALALFTVAFTVADAALYVFVYAAPTLGLVPRSELGRDLILAAIPVMQRLATVGVVLWVVAATVQTWTRTRR